MHLDLVGLGLVIGDDIYRIIVILQNIAPLVKNHLDGQHFSMMQDTTFIFELETSAIRFDIFDFQLTSTTVVELEGMLKNGKLIVVDGTVIQFGRTGNEQKRRNILIFVILFPSLSAGKDEQRTGHESQN